jgi:hypothetical protein
MKYIIPIIILSFFLFGCKDDEDETTSSTTELEGTWKTACYTDDDNNSFIITPTFAGNVLSITDEKHSDTSCATDYRLNEETHTFAMGDAGKFTITLGSTFKKTPQSSTAVTNYDNSSKCGHSDWELNTAKDCTESNSGKTIYCLYELSGTTVYIECDDSAQPTSIDKGAKNTFTKQ